MYFWHIAFHGFCTKATFRQVFSSCTSATTLNASTRIICFWARTRITRTINSERGAQPGCWASSTRTPNSPNPMLQKFGVRPKAAPPWADESAFPKTKSPQYGGASTEGISHQQLSDSQNFKQRG